MNRIFKLLMMLAVFAVLALQAVAHTSIKMTIPAHDAILAEVPATVFIRVTKKMRLTKVEVQHEELDALAINISQYKGFEKEFTLPIEPMGAGIYIISWRALGQDGHPIQGEFKFTVIQ